MNNETMKLLGFQGKLNSKISEKTIKEMKAKEQAALTMCGGLLGNCYLLAEITENIMINAIAQFKKEKWFGFQIKFCFKKSREELHNSIYRSIAGSPTNSDYMREMADATYALLKPDLFKLQNSIELELGKASVPYVKSCAEIVIVDILLRYIGLEYDDALAYMKNIFDAYYDSWYHGAKCESPAYWWNKGLKMFSDNYVKSDIDLNTVPAIQNGVYIIQKRMHDSSITEQAAKEAQKYAEDGGGEELFNEAVAALGK